MSFLETVERARAYLERNGRVSLRGLQREFELDESALDELVEELVDVQQVAAREGKVISWIGGANSPAQPVAAEPAPPTPLPAKPVVAPAVPRPEVTPVSDPGRRQLTVMFCDLVGSTPLSERLDAEDLHEVVQTYQAACAEIIQGLDGEIAQYLGDGLLVYFGYPHAHEDDALRAVRAGLRIVDDVPRLNQQLAERLPVLRDHPLQVRVGVHTGPVVVGAMGGSGRGEQLALGDTVNIASRIQGVAEPDSIVISDATRRLVPGAFVLEERGPQALKGIASPVPVFRVLRASGMQSRLELEGLTPLVGREQEVALLLDRWHDAADQHGQVLLLSGEAGMGKSRLLAVLRERLTDQPHSWLEARASAYHQNSAFHPLIELLRQGLIIAPDEPVEASLDRLRRGLTNVGLSVPETLPLLASLLSLPAPSELPALQLSPEAQRRRTLESLCAWVLALAELQPLILVMEDLHWCDPSSLELLDLLIEQAPTAPIFLVLTFRPSFVAPWPARSHVSQLALHPLTRQQMEQLVTSVAGNKALPAEVVEQIVARTDRVPLFVEEVAKAVLESNLLVEREDRYELSGPLPELAIPSTLQDSLMARLDRLGPAKEVAQLCAAMGREFSHELLAAVAPMEAPVLSQLIAGLSGAELLYRRGVAPNAVYHFKHALLQEMAYQSLLKKTRQDYHARITQALEERFPERAEAEPELVARHCAEAGLTDKAVDYYERAGLAASERSAHSESIGHFRSALELVNNLPEGSARDHRELALQVALGLPLSATRGWGSPEVEAVYARARELCREPGETPQLGAALSGLAAFYVTRSELAGAEDVSLQLLRVAEQEQQLDRRAYGHYTQGLVRYLRGNPRGALEHFDRAIGLDLESGGRGTHTSADTGVSARVWGAWALWLAGWPDQAAVRGQEAIERARRLDDPFSLAYALSWTAVVHLMRREPGKILELTAEVFSFAADQGFVVPLSVGRLCHLVPQSRAPDAVDEALAESQRIMADLGGTGTQAAAPQILGELGALWLDAGRVPEAANYLHGGLTISGSTGQQYWDAELTRLKGEVALHGGDDAKAAVHFQDALAIARSQQARSLELRTATGLARLWQRQDRASEARQLVQPIYDAFSEGFDTADLKDAKALLQELG